MSWESRRGGGRYYTRSKRSNGRIIREYVGRGDLAELAALVDQMERERRQEQEAQRKAEQKTLILQDRHVIDFCDQVDQVLAEALISSGFHQHKGEWRKGRYAKNQE